MKYVDLTADNLFDFCEVLDAIGVESIFSSVSFARSAVHSNFTENVVCSAFFVCVSKASVQSAFGRIIMMFLPFDIVPTYEWKGA